MNAILLPKIDKGYEGIMNMGFISKASSLSKA
jgi:hypothetical protein